MWEISSVLQLQSLLYSVILGALICVFYDIISAVRLTGNNSFISVCIQDLFFWIVSAFAVFFFLLGVSNGEIRGYIIFGILIGFILLKITLSKYIVKTLKTVFKFIRKILRKINEFTGVIFDLISVRLRKIRKKTNKNIKKGAETAKKLLKKGESMLYTNQYKVKSVRRRKHETKKAKK